MDLSTKLAEWKAGSVRGPIPSGLLARLERVHKDKEQRIRESRTMTEEAKRLEITEARRQFRQDWREMRGQVIEQMDAEIETARRTANPPASEAELSRMGLLANVYLKSWERAAGNMNKAADEFAAQGDRAGLRLLREHAGLAPMGARQGLLKRVGEAEEAFKTDAQRKAEQDARRLDGLRRNWLNPDGASEVELKKRTLTNLYNARPTWLANAHAQLDLAVFAAYGWPEVPDELSEEDLLKGLLDLNLQRWNEE